MKGSRKKTSLAFKIIGALTAFNLVVFFIAFFVFGSLAAKTNDADIKGGIGDVFKFHFSDVKGLFSFNFHNASNIVYFSLSGILYFLLFISLLYLVVGILFIVKRKKPILVFGIVASLLAVFIYILMATGSPKYWAIINQRGAFSNDNSLIAPTFMILLFGAFYALLAYILYFYSLFLVIKAPVPNEETAKEIEQEQAPVALEEVKEESKTEEVKEEPIEEEKEEELDENGEEKPVMFEEVIVPESEAEKIPVIEVTQPVNNQKVSHNSSEEKEDLKSMLKELIRDIVRDEVARNNANQPDKSVPEYKNPGITGPFVVQYFNGIPAEVKPTPVEQPVKVEQPAPVVEEPKKEEPPVKEEKPVKPQPEIKQAAVKQEVKTPVIEKKPIIRIPFVERMINADKEMQDNYNELKNEILSYGVNSRVSNSGDTFRLHRKTYVKITIAGLSLKLYFALNPDDYKDSTLPVQNAGHKGIYEEIPLVFKVKSGLSMRRCKQLIQDVFEKNGFEQGVVENINWVEDLKNVTSDDDD